MPDLPDPWRDLGAFIREQRASARLSLRRLSDMAGISNPYLSQIERGLRHPSAEILQQIAKALAISAETLYVRAGILEERPNGSDLVEAIFADTTLSADQKQTLVRIVTSFRREQAEQAGSGLPDGGGRTEVEGPTAGNGAHRRDGPTGGSSGREHPTGQ